MILNSSVLKYDTSIRGKSDLHAQPFTILLFGLVSVASDVSPLQTFLAVGHLTFNISPD